MGAALRHHGSEVKEAVLLALDAIRRHKLRSGLTILGVVIGVSTVVAVSSVILGLNANVIGSIESLGSNIIICYKHPWTSLGRPPSEWFTRKELKAEWAEEIARLPHVVAVAPSLRIFHPMFGAGTSFVRRGAYRAKNVILQGNPPSIQEIFNIELARGRWFTESDMAHRTPVVVLGHDLARTLFPNPWEDPIGQEVLIEGKAFTVVGVAERQKQALGTGANPEDNIAILPLSTMEKLHPEYRDYVLFVKASSGETLPQVVDAVRDLLRRKRRLSSNQPDDFAIFTPDAFVELWQQISYGIFALMFAVSSVALLVGGIGVMNIMLVSVTERTREIGIRKAIGAKRRNILWQFLLEAVTLVSVGGVVGILLGAALGLGVRLAFPSLPAEISPGWVLLAFGACAVIGILFGIYPAAKAARLDPVVALRYE
ncbi:MAG: ABC transporter permease [Firmicutes bacterium]|nr:ABC transporter permease [Bacillota bacterium]